MLSTQDDIVITFYYFGSKYVEWSHQRLLYYLIYIIINLLALFYKYCVSVKTLELIFNIS